METEHTINSRGLIPTLALHNPTPEQEKIFKSAVKFSYKFFAYKNKTINEKEKEFNNDNFAKIKQGKDNFLVYYSDNYKMYYILARSCPFLMKNIIRYENTRKDIVDVRQNREKILNDYEVGWFDVNGEIFPMDIAPFCSIKNPTSKQLNDINTQVSDFLSRDGLFELLAKDTKDGVIYYLRYRDLKLSLNTNRVINVRTIALENVRIALGTKNLNKLTYFDEINNPNTPPEKFITFGFQEIEDKQMRKYSSQADSSLAQYKSILSKHKIAPQFRPIYITKFQNEIKFNVYNASLEKMMKKVNAPQNANFDYAIIKHRGENYAILYTDDNETANYLIQRASIFNGLLKKEDKRFYTAPMYVVNNKGDCVLADYFPICIINQESPDYIEGLRILESNLTKGYRLALISNGTDTRCYIAHQAGGNARYTDFTHLKDDKITMLSSLKKNKIDVTPLNDNGLTVASYTYDTRVSFDQEFEELKL